MEVDKFRELLCITGAPDSGKTALAHLLRELIGDGNITAFDCPEAVRWCGENLGTDRPSLVRLIGEQTPLAQNGRYSDLVTLHGLIEFLKRRVETPLAAVCGFPWRRSLVEQWQKSSCRPRLKVVGLTRDSRRFSDEDMQSVADCLGDKFLLVPWSHSLRDLHNNVRAIIHFLDLPSDLRETALASSKRPTFIEQMKVTLRSPAEAETALVRTVGAGSFATAH